jgi:hypothetical protein
LLEQIDEIAPFVRHIHLHDNFGKSSIIYEKNQYERSAFGLGDMHLPPADEILTCLTGYRGVVTLELRPRYRNDCREALRNTRSLLRRFDKVNRRIHWQKIDGRSGAGLPVIVGVYRLTYHQMRRVGCAQLLAPWKTVQW